MPRVCLWAKPNLRKCKTCMTSNAARAGSPAYRWKASGMNHGAHGHVQVWMHGVPMEYVGVWINGVAKWIPRRYADDKAVGPVRCPRDPDALLRWLMLAMRFQYCATPIRSANACRTCINFGSVYFDAFWSTSRRGGRGMGGIMRARPGMAATLRAL